MPEIKPDPTVSPKPSSTSVPQEPQIPPRTTTTQSDILPTTQPQDPPKVDSSDKGNKGLRIVLAVIGMIIGSILFAGSAGIEALPVFWLIFAVLFVVILAIRKNKTEQ